jgi:hypothetical protein
MDKSCVCPAFPVEQWLKDTQEKGLLEQLTHSWKADASLTLVKNNKGRGSLILSIANAMV